jgi:hypothetical protein
MLVEKFSYRFRMKILVNYGTAVEERFRYPILDGTAEPLIDNVNPKPAFGSLYYFSGKIRTADPAVQPLLRAVPHLKVCRQALDIFDNVPVHKRDTQFEAVSHRQLVSIHKKLVRKGRSNLEKLKAAELVGLGHEISHVRPGFQYGVACAGVQ